PDEIAELITGLYRLYDDGGDIFGRSCPGRSLAGRSRPSTLQTLRDGLPLLHEVRVGRFLAGGGANQPPVRLEGRLDAAGLDDVRAHAEMAQLIVERLAERLEGVLRRRVQTVERRTDAAGEGGDVDDNAVAAIAHAG